MAYYFVLEIPRLELNFVLCVGRGVHRWFSAFVFLELRGRHYYYLSADPHNEVIAQRNIYYPWAMVEGGRGCLLVWRRGGLHLFGNRYRSRIANVVLDLFRQVVVRIPPGV